MSSGSAEGTREAEGRLPSATPRPGTRVAHPVHGPGTLLELRSGDRATVRFDRTELLPRTVTLGELLPPPGVAAALPDGAPHVASAAATRPESRDRSSKRVRPKERPAPDRYAHLQSIEALRLGVVPSAHAHEYTVGRASEMEGLDALLTDGHGLALVWGDYGAGKTHLLDVYEQACWKRGFATARAVLDPNDVPPSHPLRLWRALVRGLRYPDDAGVGIDPLLARLEESSEHRDPFGARANRFLSPVLFARTAGDAALADHAVDWISGEPADVEKLASALGRAGWRGAAPLTLSDYRTYGRVYLHLFGTLASWLRDAGHAGLCILLDEVEYVERLDAEHTRLASEVLRHFAAATMPREALRFDPDTDLYRGGHAVHRALPLRFEEGQPLAVVMALTPLEEIRELLERAVGTGAREMRLAPLRPSDHALLAERVTAIYERAFPDFRLTAGDRELVRRACQASLDAGLDSPRALIRTVVAVLDMRRCGIRPKATS